MAFSGVGFSKSLGVGASTELNVPRGSEVCMIDEVDLVLQLPCMQGSKVGEGRRSI